MRRAQEKKKVIGVRDVNPPAGLPSIAIWPAPCSPAGSRPETQSMAHDRSYVGSSTVYWGPMKPFFPLRGLNRAADGMEGREGQAVEPNITPQKLSIRIRFGESIQWRIRDSLQG